MTSYGRFMFNFIRNYQTIFTKWLLHFAFPALIWKGPTVSPHPQHLVLLDIYILAFGIISLMMNVTASFHRLVNILNFFG